MNKRTLWILIASIVIILLVAVWFFFIKKSDDTTTVNTNTNSQVLTEDGLVPESEEPIFIFNISPDSGNAAGGVEVTVQGSGFINGATVFFGDNEATNVSYSESEGLHATIPAGAGLVNVKVVNPDGRSGIFYNAFTYN